MRKLILLCTATTVEARACRAGISKADATHHFEILRSGMGLRNAHQALQARLKNFALQQPSLIVSTGFAGGWSPKLELGCWVLGRSVKNEAGEKRDLSASEDFSLVLQLPKRMSERCHSADFLSLSRPRSKPIVSSAQSDPSPDPSEAEFPIAVDMESYAWAQLSALHQIPFLILRLISDTPKDPLPDAIENFSAACLASTPADRFGYFARGISSTVARPKTVGKFLMRSAFMPRNLYEGWRAIVAALG